MCQFVERGKAFGYVFQKLQSNRWAAINVVFLPSFIFVYKINMVGVFLLKNPAVRSLFD